MPHLDTNAILLAVLYAAVTGVWNLALGHKSQVEAWALSNPRLAAVLKFTRALGFDPWNLLSSAMLLFLQKLPAAQRSDSAIAIREAVKADEKAAAADAADEKVSIIPPSKPLLVLLLAAFVCHAQACSAAPVKPPCDEQTLTVMTAKCSAYAYTCGQQGKSEEECTTECDRQLDKRAEQCK